MASSLQRLSRVLTLMFLGAAVGALNAQQPKQTFEVASIERSDPTALGGRQTIQPGGRYVAVNASVPELIQFANNVTDFQVVDAPEWAKRERFDITAKAADGASTESQVRLMLQSLLEDRFRLVARTEQREMPLYVLTVARKDGRLGPGMIKIDSQDECKTARANQKGKPRPAGAVILNGCSSIAAVMKELSLVLLRAPVVDRTGLAAGTWYFTMHFASTPHLLGDSSQAAIDPSLPSVFTAMREELGLRLDGPNRGLGNVLVVQSIQRPTEN